MENAVSLDTNCENSEDIVPIPRKISEEWSNCEETHIFLNTEKHPTSLKNSRCDYLEEETSDSDVESELAVDAIHPRLTITYYLCVVCKERFVRKKILFSHFEGGCYVNCVKCGKMVYEKVSGGKEVLVRKCSKKCQPVLANEVTKE